MRTFNYDMATGRLSSSTLPESGTTSYVNNADGTLLRKTDAKSQKAEFSYSVAILRAVAKTATWFPRWGLAFGYTCGPTQGLC